MGYTGSWVWDVQSGAPVYWSPEMCRIHGRDPGHGPPSSEAYRALCHPNDWSVWVAAVEKCVQRKSELACSCRLRMRDGTEPRVNIAGHAILGSADQVTEIIGTAVLAVEPRMDSVHRHSTGSSFRELTDLIPTLAWSSRADGSADFFNRVWLEYTGFKAEQAADWGWTDAIHPDDLTRMLEYWQSVLASPCPVEIEARLRRFDGKYRWFLFRARPQLDKDGNVIQWYGTNTDIDDRKRAEVALRDSGRELQQLVETIPAMIWRGSSEGQLDYVNRRSIDFLGDDAEGLAADRWLELVHPDHRVATVEKWLDSVRNGTPYRDVYRLRRADDGTYRWIESVGEPFRNCEGQVVRWYGLLTDIDDRKRAEDALRESELNFRLIVDTIPGLVCTMTPRGEVELVNKQVLDYFGTTLEDLRNWAFVGAVHPDDLDRVIADWRYSIETGTVYEIEHRIRRSDGVFRWFQVRGSPLRDAQQRIIRWYILLTDIEDGKRSEEAVRASETRLRLITETIPAIVTSRDAAGNLDYVNQRLVDYTGMSVEEILASRSNLVHPEDISSTAAAAQSARARGGYYEIDYRMRRADGVYRWFRVREAPLRDPRGQVLRWYAVITDIDDEKGAREALSASQARLARMAQISTVAELSASIAHEINQPLAAVLANGHACQAWLSSEPPNLERAKFTAEKIIRDTNSAAEVVRRMRALFKQVPPTKVRSDVNDMITEVLRIIGSDLRDGGVVVETELAPDLPAVVADRVQIQQILINLAHNAIEAMAAFDQPRILSFTSRLSSSEILVQVGDNGCGVENPGAIFEPFFTTKPNGMGMGLAICRSIVEAHEGRLWSTPNEGAGTTFSFSLPVETSVA